MNWLELVNEALNGWEWVRRFRAWQRERDERKASEAAAAKAARERIEREATIVKFTPPPNIPPGAIVVVLALLMMSCASLPQQVGKDLADLQVYCCERPDECRRLPLRFQCPTPIPRVTPTPAPTSTPTPSDPCGPAPGPTCPSFGDPSMWTDCWECTGRTGGRWSYIPPPRPTPTPVPTATPRPTPTTGCSAVESTLHFMAPGDHCHSWKPEGQRVRCLVDSTVRPICDEDHKDNWDSFCGRRSHDPDYERPEGAQAWTISGAEDAGPNGRNYAQRWIVGDQGAAVNVTVCIRNDAVTPDGCRITRRDDGCGTRSFNLPRIN